MVQNPKTRKTFLCKKHATEHMKCRKCINNQSCKRRCYSALTCGACNVVPKPSRTKPHKVCKTKVNYFGAKVEACQEHKLIFYRCRNCVKSTSLQVTACRTHSRISSRCKSCKTDVSSPVVNKQEVCGPKHTTFVSWRKHALCVVPVVKEWPAPTGREVPREHSSVRQDDKEKLVCDG